MNEFEEKEGSTDMFYDKKKCFALRRCQFFCVVSKEGNNTQSWLDDLLRMEIILKVTVILCPSRSGEAQLLRNRPGLSSWVTAHYTLFWLVVGLTALCSLALLDKGSSVTDSCQVWNLDSALTSLLDSVLLYSYLNEGMVSKEVHI